MITAETRFGFTVHVDECDLQSYEFVDALAQMADEDEGEGSILAAQRRVHLILLGKTQRRELVRFLKERYGQATAEMMNQAVADVFAAVGEHNAVKKSLPSPE